MILNGGRVIKLYHHHQTHQNLISSSNIKPVFEFPILYNTNLLNFTTTLLYHTLLRMHTLQTVRYDIYIYIYIYIIIYINILSPFFLLCAFVLTSENRENIKCVPVYISCIGKYAAPS